MDILQLIVNEDEEKVSFQKKFYLEGDFQNEMICFFSKLINIMNENEELIFRIENTEIDGEFKKTDDFDFRTLSNNIKNTILGESCVFNIDIYKDNSSNVINVFNFTLFFSKIKNLSIEEQLEKFQDWYENGKRIFASRIQDICIITETFYFISDQELYKKNNYKSHDRMKFIEYKNYYCNYNSKIKIKLIPSDFNVINKEKSDKELELIISRLCTYLSLIYICDFSEFEGDIFRYKIFGYKTIDRKINKSDISTSESNNLITLFKWIYANESSISDKLGITRNILSLYLTNEGIEMIDDSVLSSCRSNYSIYLKENVEKYIEVKTQQIFLLNSTIEEISDINNLYIKGFHQSLMAMFTFFFTTLLFNVISTGKINNIFTLEISVISIAIILISFIYMKISHMNAMNSFERIEKKYNKNKEMYLDIMDKEDIEKIFGGDIYFNDEKDNYKSTLNRWKWLWIIINVILIIMVVSCCCYNSCNLK